MRFYFLIGLFFLTNLFADCELVNDNTYKSYLQFKEAELLHEEKKYSEAYKTLLESFRIYTPRTKEVDLKYSCINYIPGPFAAIIQKSSKTELFDFDRRTLAIDIKHQLSPAPYVFIEFQKEKTIASVRNSVKTAQAEIKDRLPLENFFVNINGTAFEFGNIKVGQVKTLTKNNSFSYYNTITTDEEFGFKLYK